MFSCLTGELGRRGSSVFGAGGMVVDEGLEAEVSKYLLASE